jgi:putative two-component system response regulator
MPKAKILVVEDEKIVALDINNTLTKLGYDVPALVASGDEAIQAVKRTKPDLVLMDIVLKGDIDGIEAAEIIRHRYGTPLVFLTAYADEEILRRVKHIEPFGYILKPFQEKELYSAIEIALFKYGVEKKRRRERDKVRRSSRKMLATYEAAINSLSEAVEMRDPLSAGHQRKVAELACAIAEEMGVKDRTIEGIKLAALIHDVGKIRVPVDILRKPGHLDDDEYTMIKEHPKVGYDIVKGVDFPWPIADMVAQHHERLDGSGYPEGIRADAMILESRILAVAEVIGTMMVHHTYQPALDENAVLSELISNRGTLYDPQVVDACVVLFKEKKLKLEK